MGKRAFQYRETTSSIMVSPAFALRFTVYDRKQTSIKKEYNNSSLFLYIKLPNPMRKGVVLTWLFMLLAAIVAVFWQYEWLYSFPTPVPNNYQAVDSGASLNINHTLPFKTDKPVMLHFYNPDCPCSRFNIPHFKSLVAQFGHKI